MRVGAVATAALTLSLWATMGRAAEPVPSTPLTPPPDANVFILRVVAEPLIMPTTIEIDGIKVASFANRRFTAVRLEPGDHKIKTSWPIVSMQGGAKATLTVEEGKTYYLEITGVSRSTIGVPGQTYSMQMGSGLHPLDAETGAATVSTCCKFVAPK